MKKLKFKNATVEWRVKHLAKSTFENLQFIIVDPDVGVADQYAAIRHMEAFFKAIGDSMVKVHLPEAIEARGTINIVSPGPNKKLVAKIRKLYHLALEGARS